ncbi:MAG TPA: ABC transporter permease [Candidatus Dormibacteraeota bacterium]|nr:ABC transporter permease [Candidatus Dormibacteraeota bacterium]
MRLDRSNVTAIARREYLARARTRTFKLTTVVLVIAGLAIALAPVILRAVFGEGKQTTIDVIVGSSNPAVDVGATVAAVLNTPVGGGPANPADKPPYRVDTVTDDAAARAAVQKGDVAGLLIVSRPTAGGDLSFTYVTKASALDRVTPLVQQAATFIEQKDRLVRFGLSAADQARLSTPAAWHVQPADPNAPKTASPGDIANGFAAGFVLAIILFMAIVLYGQWIAYSVAEEKSSRVMEVILGAATPFELLGGKVVGVGALAITQYVIVFVPALLALVFQSQIAALVLGGSASAVAVPQGLSIGLLVAFGVFFVLGFALYAVLYAGAAALVSRTEDINQMVAPMTLISTAGYLVAVYSSTGLIDPSSTFVVVMSFIPFFSPYLMLSRLGAGLAGPVEVVVALVLLAVTVPVALWVAARLYSAGVLMYGQRPSLRLMLRVLRGRA